jgi:hypothetical protein
MQKKKKSNSETKSNQLPNQQNIQNPRQRITEIKRRERPQKISADKKKTVPFFNPILDSSVLIL